MRKQEFESFDNVVGVFAWEIGVDKEVSGANVPDGAGLGLGFLRRSGSLRMQAACKANEDEGKKSDHDAALAGATRTERVHSVPLGKPALAFYQEGIATWNTEEKIKLHSYCNLEQQDAKPDSCPLRRRGRWQRFDAGGACCLGAGRFAVSIVVSFFGLADLSLNLLVDLAGVGFCATRSNSIVFDVWVSRHLS
jgi:hypothetical protein